MHIGLGCVRLGGGDGRSVADDVRLVRGAIDLGVSVFDTADVYGGGASEHVLGKALGPMRDEVQIATKAGFVFRPRSPFEQWSRRRAKEVLGRVRPDRGAGRSAGSGAATSYANQDFSACHLRDAVHSSLRRLRTDRIDVFQLHGPDTAHPDLVAQLADLVTAGDIVRLGIGADSVPAVAPWLGVRGISVLQVPFGVLDTEAAAGSFAAARGHGQHVWVRGLLGGGLLGQVGRDPAALADHPKRRGIERVASIATDAGLDIHELALRFAVAHAEGFTTALVGSTSLAHLAANIKVLSGPPLADDIVADVLRAFDTTDDSGSDQ